LLARRDARCYICGGLARHRCVQPVRESRRVILHRRRDQRRSPSHWRRTMARNATSS
jgi:hypothetical protein